MFARGGRKVQVTEAFIHSGQQRICNSKLFNVSILNKEKTLQTTAIQNIQTKSSFADSNRILRRFDDCLECEERGHLCKLVYKVPVYLSRCYYKWRERERFAWSGLLQPDGARPPLSFGVHVASFPPISISIQFCVIILLISLLFLWCLCSSMWHECSVKLLHVAVLRPLLRPVVQSFSRVGEPDGRGAQIPTTAEQGMGNGREAWLQIAPVMVSTSRE